MSGRQIPSHIWNDPITSAPDPTLLDLTSTFMDEAGLRTPENEDQNVLCAICAAEGNLTPPTDIVFINGTSLCINHM